MTVTADDVFVGAKFPQSHRTSCVEFLGGDAHFASQSKLTTVGKSGGSVDIHGGTVHTGGKGTDGIIVGRKNGFRVTGGVGGNVGDRLGYTVNAFYR